MPLRQIWLGRDRELAELGAGLDDLAAGHGSVFLIAGEPGIGKTRLADETARLAAARGFRVHWGRAWEAGGAPSYWPFVQILRAIVRGLDGAALDALIGVHAAELAELVPELRTRVPADARPAHDRFALFEAVGATLQAAAARTPCVLVFDDLHAADPSSLSLVHFLVRDVRAAPLLVIGTYREAEVRIAPDTARTLAQIGREATTLVLRRLDRAQVAELVAKASGDPVDLDAFYARTEGNPLFVRELLQLRQPGPRQPDGIREVVRARVALPPPEVRAVLEIAAVLGREVDTGQLAKLAGEPVEDRLARAADAGLVEPTEAAARWRFTHVLLREGIYDAIEPSRRAELHRAVAASQPSDAFAERAHHALLAVPAIAIGDAADAALRAAGRALELCAYEDAAALLRRTIAVLEPAGDRPRTLAALELLGIAETRAGEVARGRATCRRAMDLAREVDNGVWFARAVLASMAEFTPCVRDAAHVALLEEALARLPDGDGALRARCMAQLAAERQPEPDTRAPIALAREAIAMARRLGDVEALRFTLSNAGLAMVIYADPEERTAVNREALQLAVAAGDKVMELRAHLLLANDCWELGDFARGATHFDEHRRLVGGFRPLAFQGVVTGLDAIVAACEGRFVEARRLAEETLASMVNDEARGGGWSMFPFALARAFEDYDVPALVAGLRAAFVPYGELERLIAELFVAQVYGRAGDRAAAAAQLARVTAHPLFDELREPVWFALLAEPCQLVGDAALAERLQPSVARCAHRFFTLGPFGLNREPPYTRFLGLFAEARGRIDEAIAYYTETETRVAAAGTRASLARARMELARALLARGDRTRAASLLADARALAVELDQRAVIDAIDALGTPLPARATPRPMATSFTMRREGEVWALEHAGATIRLRDSRGLQVLAQLVERPDHELHVLQLAAAAAEDGDLDRGDAGEVLDATAVQRYRARLLELRAELEEAEEFADLARSEKARDEIELLTSELARAVGLGGRMRRAGNAAERARTTVQKRLRDAIRRIAEQLPELGTFLDGAIRTGTFCVYAPQGRARR